MFVLPKQTVCQSHHPFPALCVPGEVKTTANKFHFTSVVVNSGFDVLYLDFDTIFFKDPLPPVLQAAEKADMLLTRDFGTECINIGVVFMKSHPDNAQFMEDLIIWLWHHPYEFCQKAFAGVMGLEVCFLVSGEKLAALALNEFEEKTAKAVKQTLADQIRVTRFRQRLFSEDGSEILDDEVFDSIPVRLHIAILEVCPGDAAQVEQMLSASARNDLIELEKLLNIPLNPDVLDALGRMPLHNAALTPLGIAALNGHVDIVRLWRSDMKAVPASGAPKPKPTKAMKAVTAMKAMKAVKKQASKKMPKPMKAVQNIIFPVVDFIWPAEADAQTLMVVAAKNAQAKNISTEQVRAKTLHGAGLLGVQSLPKDQATEDGLTVLFMAAQAGHLAVVLHLLEVGADKDQAANDGATPMLVAAENGQFEVVHSLVAVGAEKDRATNYGWTPLFGAAFNGHLEAVRHLIEVGADKDQANKDGVTPLGIAALNGYVDIVRLLVEAGANKEDGSTVLFMAAQEGHLDVVRHLLEVGADKDQAANDGATPMSPFHGRQLVWGFEKAKDVQWNSLFGDIVRSVPRWAFLDSLNAFVTSTIYGEGAMGWTGTEDQIVIYHFLDGTGGVDSSISVRGYVNLFDLFYANDRLNLSEIETPLYVQDPQIQAQLDFSRLEGPVQLQACSHLEEAAFPAWKLRQRQDLRNRRDIRPIQLS
eukprot:s145_g36.t1